MKFLCPHCERLTLLDDFELDGASLVIRCGACQAASRVEPRAQEAQRVESVGSAASPGPAPERDEASPAPAPPSAPAVLSLVRPRPRTLADDAVPEGFCPKCIARRAPGALTCPQCGLVFDNFNPAHFELSPELAALWTAARDARVDELPAKHLLAVAHQRGELPLLARLYRIRLAQDPHDVIAQAGRDEVLRLASTPGPMGVQEAAASAGLQGPGARRVLVVAILAVIFLLVYFARVMLHLSAK